MNGPRRYRRVPIGVVMAALGLCLSVSFPARGDEITDARRHAQRASRLAAKSKCRQAVAEFDKAIPVLRDPTLLFNRGECHRKLGNAAAALQDYDQFLKELPTAPNRVEVERRIAELKAAQAPDSVAASPGTRGESGRSPASRKEPAEAAPRSNQVTGRHALGGARGAGAAALEPGPPSLLSRREPPVPAAPDDSHDSLARRPWFWIAVGAVAVAAGAGVFLVLSREATTIPASDLGNFKF